MLVTEHGAGLAWILFQLYREAGGNPGAGLTNAEARRALGLNVWVLVRSLRNGILAPKREMGEPELLFAMASPGEISAPTRKLPAEDKRPWAHVCKHISGPEQC